MNAFELEVDVLIDSRRIPDMRVSRKDGNVGLIARKLFRPKAGEDARPSEASSIFRNSPIVSKSLIARNLPLLETHLAPRSCGAQRSELKPREKFSKCGKSRFCPKAF